MYCACSCACFYNRVCPTLNETAAPRRTRRSPPRVLFLACAGSCSCACLLRAPAPRPAIDAGQGPTPRSGVSFATGLSRMSTRPPDQSGRPAHAGEIAKVQCSRFAKTQPAPHPASALILAWTLPRSCTPAELQPAPVLRKLKPAPPRLVPRTLRRRHTIQQYQRDAVLPTEPPDGQLQTRSRCRQFAQPKAGRRGAPTFALASLDLARCSRRLGAQTAGCGSLRQSQHQLSPLSVQVFLTPAAA